MSSNQVAEEDKDLGEFKALTSVLKAQVEYEPWAKLALLKPKQQKWESLTTEEQKLLPWFPQYLKQIEHSIELNGKFFTDVAETVSESWGAGSDRSQWFPCTYNDLDKVKGIMTQLVREWSEYGKDERDVSFGKIIKFCEKLFPDVAGRQNLEVLVPGAGLGRLVIELVKRGFKTQGNEFSYHMLLNSSYIMNSTFCANNYLICPFIHKGSNVAKRNSQLRQVYIPDYNPGDVSFINKDYPDIPVGDLMSMVAGSFVDLYGPPDLGKITETYSSDPDASQFRLENKNKFDAITTCYFLDTATNIIDYLKTIRHCLKDDGHWINFGPLLWHYEEDEEIVNTTIIDPVTNQKRQVPTPMKGLELSRDDLIQLITDIGFKFIEHESGIKSTYGGNNQALGGWNYECEFWVCQKQT